ncbi:hypothetical protein ABZ845_28265 [Streptomyces sp. NPDC047022]
MPTPTEATAHKATSAMADLTSHLRRLDGHVCSPSCVARWWMAAG